jgi:hypothetical protein
MSYPEAPWALRGASVQAFRFTPVSLARELVPRRWQIVAVVPGKTLSALYCASYGPGSALEYHELIVAPALARVGRHVGFCISHIYVDDSAASDGGRAIWGLPKQAADFHWSAERHLVEVRQDGQCLCRIAWDPGSPRLPIPLLVPFLGGSTSDTRWSMAAGTARIAIAPAEIAIDANAPYASLGFQKARRLVSARLRVRIAGAKLAR